MTASYRTDKDQILSFVYDVAVDGGATGTYTCPLVIPDNAIIIESWIDVLTTFTDGASDTATIAVSTGQSANDLVSAISVATAGDVWDAGIRGTLATFPNLGADAAHDSALEGIALVAGTKLKMTANRKPTVVVGTAALTAGKMEVFIRYIIGK